MEGGRHEDPLALDPETMRELGYRTVDLLVERLQREEPPIRRATPAEMRERLHGPAPAKPSRSTRSSPGSTATCSRSRAATATRASSRSSRSPARGPARSAT